MTMSAMTELKGVAREGLRRTGLSGPYYRARDRHRARTALRRAPVGIGPDGLPVPPPELITQVAGPTAVDEFLAGGARAADDIRGILERNGVAMRDLGAILDFGCGCGRVLRQWAGLSGPDLHGTDYNPALVEWCSANLPFARLAVNGLEPPLPYPDGRFDLVYAMSVFTHLTEAQHHAWMAELRRVLRPGGHLVFTTHGDAHLGFCTEDELAAYRRGELVVLNPDMAGRNACGALHPRAWVTGSLLRGVELVDDRPEGGTGNGRQDIWLVRRSA
jgi:SAM-dependent methyltransferase